ncbi:hypothetical protein [Myxococcus xanthus]|uniref:hypothetical protein n=1 Tax=Myxococcus xanthus TaxID=34 RepID=UPI001125B5E9|nr:hypothetical protein [Myxococcus xanthus]
MVAGVVAIAGAVVVLVIMGFFTGLWGPLRYREFNQIRARFEEMPGVKVVDAWGNEDITFEDIGVTVELAGKGRISFTGLTLASFERDGDSSITVQQVGPHFFADCTASVLEDGTLEVRRYGASLNLGTTGDFGSHLPFVAHRVQDVIENADALLAALDRWPKYPDFLEVPCMNTWDDGTTSGCIRIFNRDGSLVSDRAVTRFSICDEPVVLRACDSMPRTVEEQRAEDRAIQSLQQGFRDHPPGESAAPEKPEVPGR